MTTADPIDIIEAHRLITTTATPLADIARAVLDDHELRAWAKQVKRAMFDSGVTKVEDAAVIDPDIYVRKPQHASGFHRVHGDYILISAPCASWTRGQRFTIELYRNGQVQWKGPDASVREMYLHICKVHPRWRVPQGDVPMCVVLRERNGWEGESWRYAFSIEHEGAALALVNLSEPCAGNNSLACQPFRPRNSMVFGSWSLTLDYLREEDAKRVAETSRAGYMAFHNYSETAGAELAALLKQAEESNLNHWAGDSVKSGVNLWKARVTLCDEHGNDIAEVDLSR